MYAYLAALAGTAALLRFLYLDAKGLWIDEGVSYLMATAKDRPHDSFWAYQALYHELLRGWVYLGDSEFFLRLFSVIPSIATIPLVYVLAKRLFDRRVGLLSALLLAVHVAHITYSQQARSYGLVVFLCTLATYFFLRAVEDAAISDWALYVLFSALAVYSHLLACLVIPAQLLSSLALPARAIPWRRLLLSAAILAAVPLPLALLIIHGGAGGTAFISAASYRQLPAVVTLLAGSVATLPCYLAFWLLGGRLAVRTFSACGRSLASWRVALLLSWCVAPAILLLLVSLVKPALVPRYLLVCVPAAVILAAYGLAGLRLRPRVFLAAATVLLSLLGLIYYQTRPREDWRGAARYVFAQAQPGDAILVLPSYSRLPFLYYRSRFGGDALPLESPDAAAPGAAGLERLAHYRRLWVLVYGRGPSDSATRACLNGLNRDFHLESSRAFTMVKVQLYARMNQGILNGKD